MSWRPINRKTYPLFSEYLRTNEWRHVTLSSNIKHGKMPLFGTVGPSRIWICEDHCGIKGGLSLSRFGAVLPSFDPQQLNEAEVLFLQRLLLSRRDIIFSTMGMANCVEFIESLLGETPQYAVNYQMLTEQQILPSLATGQNIEIRPAEKSDMDAMWPLEKGYQMEEVLRPGSQLNTLYARKRLEEALNRQKIFCVLFNGKMIAKAATNARGYVYDQIGGVYVLPQWRRQSIGYHVMCALLSSIESEGRRACLFVKENNAPAQRLYKHLGFREQGRFRISYWHPSLKRIQI